MHRCDPHTPQVLTLIGASATSGLDADRAEAVAAALRGVGAEVAAPDWLAPSLACDLFYRGVTPEAAEAAARETLGDAGIDLAAQPRAGRRKAALIADMDSTIVTSETLDELSEAVGVKEAVAAITARAMNGELDFAEALRARVEMLEGLDEGAIGETLARVTFIPGARTLVATMRAHGAETALVSGGFTAIAEPVAELCGFDRVVANRLLIDAGRLTGRVAEPIVGKEAKLATLDAVAARVPGARAAVAAVGDGANDLPMLLAAGLGVAYRAKPRVRAEARVCLDHADLSALLYLQGYRTWGFVD